RLTSGAAGLHAAPVPTMLSKSRSTLLASYRGEVAIASTRPVDGSSATAAPQFDPSARTAVRCTAGSIVSTSELPLIVRPVIPFNVVSSTVWRFEFEP